MATYSIPGQNLSAWIPDEGTPYYQDWTKRQLNVRQGSNIYTIDASNYAGDTSAFKTAPDNQEGLQWLNAKYQTADPTAFSGYMGTQSTGNQNYTKTVSPINPNGAVITGSNSGVIAQSPTALQAQANAATYNAATGGQSTPPPDGFVPPAPLNLPGKSTEAPLGDLLKNGIMLGLKANDALIAQGKQPLPVPGATPEIIKEYNLSKNWQANQLGPDGKPLPQYSGGPTTSAPPPNPITSATSLGTSVAMDSFLKTITDQIKNLSAGLPVGGQSKVLSDLMASSGIKAEQDMLAGYNQIVLDQQKKLKELPDQIKNSLSAVGVTADQLARLQAKETKPILDALNETMGKAGALQDQINQSLKIVGMFADASQADQAAKLEISKFQIQEGLNIYGELKQDQRDALTRSLTDQTNRMTLAGTVSSNGAPKDVVDAIINAPDYATAMSLSTKYLSSKALDNYASGLATQIAGKPAADQAKIIADFATAHGYDPVMLGGMVQQSLQKSSTGLSEFESAYLKTYGTMPGIAALEAYNASQKTVTDSSSKPLSPSEIQQYQIDHPNAGIVAGDTLATATSKVTKANAPQTYDSIKAAAIAAGANEQQAIAEADLAVKQGIITGSGTATGTVATAPTTPIYGTGNFSNIDMQARIDQLKGFKFNNTQIINQLEENGYPKDKVLSALGGPLDYLTSLFQ